MTNPRNTIYTALVASLVLVLSACGPGATTTSPSPSVKLAQYETLRDAITANDGTAVAEFLASGEAVDQDMGSGFEPLHVAALNDSDEAAQALIDAGADVEARASGGVTPLMLASQGDGADTVVVLLAAGADATAQDSSGPGAGPMHYAARANNVAALQTYLDHGLDVDTLGTYSTPLIFAAYYGATEASLFLLDNGADINALDCCGSDVIQNAEGGGFPELAETLRAYETSAE